MSQSDAVVNRPRGGTGVEGMSPDELAYPTADDLRKRAKRRVPRFAYDFATGGCGENESRERNRKALDAIQIVPRYGLGGIAVSTKVELFGHTYAAPIGMAPMGLGGLIWPGMEKYLAAAAQAANTPYVLSTPASENIETIAAIAPDVFWFQTYAAPDDDFRMTFDMLRRAERGGAKALLVTIDTPVRAKRPQDMRNRLAVPFKPNLRTILDIAKCPEWLLEVWRQGTPVSANFVAYMKPNPTADEVAKFVQGKLRGGYTWDTIRRLRDVWPGAMVIKGVLHPKDAEMAARVGADGVLVSNHGGRTFDAAPPAIEMLPAVKAAIGDDLVVLLDSGIRSGLDIARGIAVGAKAVLAGRPFLYSVGALGPKGGKHLLDLLIDETRMAMGQIGTPDLDALGRAEIYRPVTPGLPSPTSAGKVPLLV